MVGFLKISAAALQLHYIVSGATWQLCQIHPVRVYSLVSDMGRNNLVLNLAAVDHLPSMALAKLVMLNRKVQAGNGRLALCQLSPTVKEILESTHLSDFFNIFAMEQEAL
jgi:anti-anti-sigma factor